MQHGIVDTVAQPEQTSDKRIYGITLAQVIDNVDSELGGRVKIRAKWSNLSIWARVAPPMAGPNCGMYFIPQNGDEVLVAFNQGDTVDAYIIGSVWNGVDRPPTLNPTDAITKRIIKTPQGLELIFDDSAQSITIISGTKQEVTIGPSKVEITTRDETAENTTATVSINGAGDISVKAERSIALKAPKISIDGDIVEINSSNNMSINGGQLCDLKAAIVKINS